MVLGKRKGKAKQRIRFQDKRTRRQGGFTKPRSNFLSSKSSGFVDMALTNMEANTTGTIVLVATIPQGSSDSQRIGKKAVYSSFQIRGTFSASSQTTTSHGALILVYDKRPTGTLPAITDVLDSANANSFTNQDNSGRFQIVRRFDDMAIGNHTTGGQQTSATARPVNDFVPVALPVVYKSVANGQIADIEMGAVYLISVGNVTSGLTDSNYLVRIRTRYMDTNG